ncbi:MAG: glutathione S-transferase [Arenimonas sp.]
MNSLPQLYSFRRCPYAIRARLAIAISGIMVETIEVDLKAKPERMLQLSPKATVPVLVLPDGKVIDESLDIMLWALRQHDPSVLLELLEDSLVLIQRNDGDFKKHLDRYKYPDRYPEFSQLHYREQCEIFLRELEERLNKHRYLSGDEARLSDIALMPFMRQFALVDREWFDASGYSKLRDWLDAWMTSALFVGVMKKV